MAESVINFAVETMGNMVIEEAKFLRRVKDQVEDLQSELDRLLSFLGDAEARQNEKENLRVWISQTRDIVYEAEDLLESYAFKIASQNENIFKRSVCILNECYVSHSIGSNIQRLQSKISGLSRRFHELGIRAVIEREGSNSSSVLQLRRTYSKIIEDDFIGLDKEVEMVVEELVNDRCATVSITGMGGLGKTTLARKVYSHRKVHNHFHSLAWVCISQQWQKREILEGILIKFFPTKRDQISKWKEEELIRELSLALKNKKSLVVLDDIWSIEAWEYIKNAFPISKEGSKLLLTTRMTGVALHIAPNGFHFEPRLLNDIESWEVLQKKTLLRERTNTEPEEMDKMEKLGKEMVKHCGGLPLAVVVLGGILVTKRDIQGWERVHKNVKAYIGKGKNIAEERGEVEKILALSYNDLPAKLKSCFIYLARFPEDSDIDVDKLYQLWIAEGMVSKKDQIGEESMMEVAERYLGELAERSMVQVKIDELKFGMTRFMYCRLHDLMRDLSLEKAREENFLLSIQSWNGFGDDQIYRSSSSVHQIHRLVVHFREEDVPKYVPPHKRITEHLRSLSLLLTNKNESCGNSMPRTIRSQLRWSRMLRILEIEGLQKYSHALKDWCCVAVDDFELSKVLGNLIHLRYLSLRRTDVMFLSSSIGNLKHLQTIDLLRTNVVLMPNVFWKMSQLKYMYLPLNFKIWRGQKLRFDGLNKLEILIGFDSRKCSYKDLLKLTNLRQLEAELYVDVECDGIMEIITFISNSESLRHASLNVVFPEDDSLPIEKSSAVLAELFSCRNIIELTLFNRISNLPKYEVGFASDLISLYLEYTGIIDDPMETLEKLPNLKSLILDDDSFWGAGMRCSATGFRQLRDLQLVHLPNLEEWIIAEGGMPNLSKIVFLSCPKLKMVPDGLRFIATLKEFVALGMPREFKCRLVIDGQEGEDFYKIRHVSSVKIGH